MLSKLTLEYRVGSAAQPIVAHIDIELFERTCPKAVRNFVFLSTSHLLTPEERAERAGGIGGQAPPLPPVPPLVGSRVSRVDIKSGTVEFGTSASRSIFGNFFDDEIVVPASSSSSTAVDGVSGKLLMSNVGPNTNASRFVLILGPNAPKDFDVHAFTCFGVVRRGLDELRELCGRVKVNGSSIPYHPITITTASIEHSKPLSDRRVIRKSVGGRRGRDDDNEDAEEGEKNDNTGTLRRDSADAEGETRFAKRRRGEIVSIRPDGTHEVVTTAIPHAEGQKFDIFKAQEHAFHNDLLEIASKQASRLHKKDNRKGRAHAFTHKGGGGGKKKKAGGRRY